MSQTLGPTKLAYSRTWYQLHLPNDPRPLGRLASSIAMTLMGKHKPIYDPSTDCGDYVVATGCSQLYVTGKKWDKKMYYSHSTRPGSLQSMNMERLAAKWGGGEILKRAVRGMLPKNRLRDKRMGRLRTYEGEWHPYKENIVRHQGSIGIGEMENVKASLDQAKVAEQASKPEAASS